MANLFTTLAKKLYWQYVFPIIKIFFLLLFLTTAILQASATARPNLPEYQVKAALLYKLAKFVEWPEESFINTDKFNICVLGRDPFGQYLDQLKGASIKNLKVNIMRSITFTKDFHSCHVLFISQSKKDSIHDLLEMIKTYPILTVSEISKFYLLGGMINFNTTSGRVGFSINPAPSKFAKLKISAQLLEYAQNVEKNNR